MSDIFLSYTSTDHERVRPLIQALERQGWTVWWDRAMLPGNIFDQVIEEALGASRCVIVAWSQTSVRSTWVRDEADKGRQRGILIPVLFDDIDLPLGFGRFQTARLVDWDSTGTHQELERVVLAVARLLGAPSSAETAKPGVGESPERQREGHQYTDRKPLAPASLQAQRAVDSQETQDWQTLHQRGKTYSTGTVTPQGSRSKRRFPWWMLVMPMFLIAPLLPWVILSRGQQSTLEPSLTTAYVPPAAAYYFTPVAYLWMTAVLLVSIAISTVVYRCWLPGWVRGFRHPLDLRILAYFLAITVWLTIIIAWPLPPLSPWLDTSPLPRDPVFNIPVGFWLLLLLWFSVGFAVFMRCWKSHDMAR